MSAVYVEKHKKVAPQPDIIAHYSRNNNKTNSNNNNNNDSSNSGEESSNDNNWSERLRNFTQKKQVRQYSASSSKYF